MLIGLRFLNLLVGCFNAAFALLVAAGVIGYIFDSVSLVRFERRYRGRWLLVAGSRHGWYDFIRNNVAPVLPEDTEVVLSSGASVSMLRNVARLRLKGAKPLLVHITERGEAKHASLHEQLLPLKQRAARDPEVQRQVAAVIAAARAHLTLSG
jgi:hypothetical protein